MKNIRSTTLIGGLLLTTATLALAQTAPPPPITPEPPTPAAAPHAVPATRAIPWPAPAAQVFGPAQPAGPTQPATAPQPATPWPGQLDNDWQNDVQVDVQTMLDLQLDKLEKLDLNLNLNKLDWKLDNKMADTQEKAFEKIQEMQDRMFLADGKLGGLAFQPQVLKTPTPMPAIPPIPPMPAMRGKGGSDDAIYQRGLGAIDAHHYDEAVEDFNQVVAHGGSRTEGGLYWKAYTLNKLGRSPDALAAIDQLRKSYPASRWLDDAKALEVEVKQSSGKAVSPEGETDEDIKILALNGLMQSDPERALPQVETLLKSSHSPRLKRQAIIVLGLNSSPRARQDLEQIARGGNPDLQMEAIRYLSRGKDANYGQLFSEIYAASSDVNVKRAILSSYSVTKDKDRLAQIARTEKNNDLRSPALGALGEIDGQPELWQIYQGETTPEGKETLLGYMHQNGNMDKLAEVARTDKDAKVRMAAIRAIGSQRSGTPSTVLVSIYSAPDQDAQVKRTIVGSLAGARNGKALVDMARSEKDIQMKLRIVEQLSNMAKYSPEARDYLQEVLNK